MEQVKNQQMSKEQKSSLKLLKKIAAVKSILRSVWR